MDLDLSFVDWALVIAFVALVVSFVKILLDRSRNKKRDAFEKRTTQEAAETQRRILEIREAQHAWDREDRDAKVEAEHLAEEEANSADVLIRFGFRDSVHSLGRVIATNHGPANAVDVDLHIFGANVLDEAWEPIEPIFGEDYGLADLLHPTESVHVGVSFGMGGGPQPADLRYRITWYDGRGRQKREGRVPIPD